MKGDGYYSKTTASTKDVIDNAIPLIIDAINSINLTKHEGPFRVKDLSCVDGGTSVELWRSLFSHFLKSCLEIAIGMIYAYLSRNDFSQVLHMFHGQTKN
jgi:hypothetical protein